MQIGLNFKALPFFPCLFLAIGRVMPAIAQVPDKPVSVATSPLATPVEAVVNHLVGIMDTSVQAAVDPSRASVQMTTCHVEVEGTAEAPASVYLYQEQALSDRLDSPYRQRFLHIILIADEVVASHTFKPTAAEEWVGLCDHPLVERQVPSTAFTTKVVCTIELQPAISGYVGNTPPGGCPVNLWGAVRLTNTVILHADGMDIWDRGFDAEGNQVWGAEDTPYEFRWRDRSVTP